MNNLKLLALLLTTFVALGGCAKKAEPLNVPSGAGASPAASSEQPLPLVNTSASGFDINQVPVVNPTLGAFPYFSLIEGYRRAAKSMAADYNKDVAFDRYEFFDGTKIIPVEGRLASRCISTLTSTRPTSSPSRSRSSTRSRNCLTAIRF